MSERRSVDINVPALARVEGEGALDLRIRDGAIEDLALRIYEPPRLFERFLEGRDYTDVADTVARICGICPVAYQMSAVQALESIFGVEPGDWARRMRRVFYCGEWLQSHALHIHLLAAPDFFGYNSALEMAQDYPDEVRRGLHLQGLGNELMALFGGRAVHPVGVAVGGFHKAPDPGDVAAMRARLEAGIPQAEELVRWLGGLELPADEQAFTSVALAEPERYAIEQGRLVSDNGLDIGIDAFDDHFREEQSPHSTAFHAYLHDQPYLVGPLARLNCNGHLLPEPVRAVMAEAGVALPARNMFHSATARAVEILFALREAVDLLADYWVPDAPRAAVTPRAGVGFGATEAPRGVLWHRYETDEDGHIRSARIVPPTSQNQARIEADLRRSLEHYGLEHSDDELRLRGEMVIRNYDPCISCATHFLTLNTERA